MVRLVAELLNRCPYRKQKQVRISKFILLVSFCCGIISCKQSSKQVYTDNGFIQEYSVKYYTDSAAGMLLALAADRNRNIQVLTENGIVVPDNGQLFYSGRLIRDLSYSPMLNKKIIDFSLYHNQFIYLDSVYIFSNAWAGKLQISHGMQHAKMFAAGKDFSFLIYDGKNIAFINSDGKVAATDTLTGIKQIKFQEKLNRFILVTSSRILAYSPGKPIEKIAERKNITCAEPLADSDSIAAGTAGGYFIWPDTTLHTLLPACNITSLTEINHVLWFGTSMGAFHKNEQGKYSYYAGERWLPGNNVVQIQQGPDSSVLVLTDKGLAQIISKKMTLEEKAMFFERQVRQKNIRYGLNCSASQLPNGYSTAVTGNQPSDNLWTSMYLASQLYRYRVTSSEEAKQNAMEAFDAMERLFTVTNIPGLFARSYERDYKTENTKGPDWERKELYSGSPANLWLRAADHPNWTWRSTASSDQTVGQIFALTTVLELADDETWKNRARKCLSNLMDYILKNNLYIIDVDGEPTLWGKWNPDYVNAFPKNVGDRRLYSSNITAFLQAAYKFSGDKKFREKAEELLNKYGYLDNLMRPISEIGPSDATELSKILSEEWNHSDDEMYFLAYPSLVKYALTPALKKKYIQSITDHWNSERTEKNALWNFIYAMTTGKDFDLKNSIGFLQQYPLDLRNWGMQNSHRKDIELIPDNFRKQTTSELLPLSELPLYRHNGNIYQLDSNGNGTTLISAGDVWLLPYWMGRYLGIISPPGNSENQVHID